MEKIDYKKELKHLYRPSVKKAGIVEVPPMNFLMIDGAGDPNSSQAFQEAVNALFSLSYTVKFMIKQGEQQLDYGVLPLEGLWWTDDMGTFSVKDKSSWKWTLMIMQPEPVNEEIIQKGREKVREKKNPSALPKVRFESFAEGRAAQIMHLGPFSDEGPTVERLHASIDSQGGKLCGRHHEIYLSDIRRAAPKNLKTVIRQPFSL
ncbi:MAG: GyrI-like domain-containing protein [Spirochaetales bacterium]|nr:GyrI-like domain-containing protein [Spirochaetales bacterium]MCF7938946.1 GyrI-like domain-containing protein [Spirochaetales bacterium]